MRRRAWEVSRAGRWYSFIRIISGCAAASSGSSCRRRSRVHASRSAAIVAGQDPGGIELPGLRGQQPEAEPLDRFDAVLDLGVITVEGVEEPHLPGAGHLGQPVVGGDVRGDDLVAPAGAFLEGGQLLQDPPGGLNPAHDQSHSLGPAGQVTDPGQLGDLVGQPLAVGSRDLVQGALLPQRGRPHVLGQ